MSENKKKSKAIDKMRSEIIQNKHHKLTDKIKQSYSVCEHCQDTKCSDYGKNNKKKVCVNRVFGSAFLGVISIVSIFCSVFPNEEIWLLSEQWVEILFAVLFSFLTYANIVMPWRLQVKKQVKKELEDFRNRNRDFKELPVLAEHYHTMKMELWKQKWFGEDSQLIKYKNELESRLLRLRELEARALRGLERESDTTLRSVLDERLGDLGESIVEVEIFRSKLETVEARIRQALTTRSEKLVSLRKPLSTVQLILEIDSERSSTKDFLDQSNQMLIDFSLSMRQEFRELDEELTQQIQNTGVAVALEAGKSGDFDKDMATIDAVLETTAKVIVGN